MLCSINMMDSFKPNRSIFVSRYSRQGVFMSMWGPILAGNGDMVGPAGEESLSKLPTTGAGF